MSERESVDVAGIARGYVEQEGLILHHAGCHREHPPAFECSCGEPERMAANVAAVFEPIIRRLEQERDRARDSNCHFAGPKRGDCEHFIGLPAVLDETTTDEFGKPLEWCWWCWKVYLLDRAQSEVRALRASLAQAEAERDEKEAALDFAAEALAERTRLQEQAESALAEKEHELHLTRLERDGYQTDAALYDLGGVRLNQMLEDERARVKVLEAELARAAREINCAGPVDQRIRAMRQELTDRMVTAETRAGAAEGREAMLEEALTQMRDTLSEVLLRAPGYDWNSDPRHLTLMTGGAFSVAKRALAAPQGPEGSEPVDLAAKFYERVKDIPSVLRVELKKPSGPTIVTVVSGISDLGHENRIYDEELKFADDHPGGWFNFELVVEPAQPPKEPAETRCMQTNGKGIPCGLPSGHDKQHCYDSTLRKPEPSTAESGKITDHEYDQLGCMCGRCHVNGCDGTPEAHAPKKAYQ